MLENIIPLKIKKLKSLIDQEFEEIVVLEVRIRGRQKSIKTLPDDADKALRSERVKAEIEKFQDQITGKEYNIEVMQDMIKDYEKIDREGKK